MAKFSRRTLYRRSSRKNNRSSRKQRGGDANDGGYGQTQSYFNPDFQRPEGPAYDPAFSRAPTPGYVIPQLNMSPTTPLNTAQGSGAVPEFQQSQIGAGRRMKRRKNNRKNRSIKKNRK